jgi:hypothetical protein
MKALAKMRAQAPFSLLCQAVLDEDIEVKAAVVQFINTMIMGIESVQGNDQVTSNSSVHNHLDPYYTRFRRPSESEGGNFNSIISRQIQ